MLEVKKFVLGQLQTNCYLVWDSTGQCIIIDPADDPEFIAEKISSLDLQPQYILATHGHFDHILGATGLKLIYQIPFLCSQKDQFLVESMTKRAKFWQKGIAVPAPIIDRYLEDKEEIVFGKSKLAVIETPGHTPGSLSFYNSKENLLFSGDTLFKEGVGRTDLAYSSASQLKSSLQTLFKLPLETAVYPGHGEATTIEEELNPL